MRGTHLGPERACLLVVDLRVLDERDLLAEQRLLDLGRSDISRQLQLKHSKRQEGDSVSLARRFDRCCCFAKRLTRSSISAIRAARVAADSTSGTSTAPSAGGCGDVAGDRESSVDSFDAVA